MTVQQLIDNLNTIEDKEKLIGYAMKGHFLTLDNMVGVNEYQDVVELQHEIKINQGVVE